jgi:hypothetical protein
MQAAKAKVLAEIKPLSGELADLMVKKLLNDVTDSNGENMTRLKKEARG